MFFQLGSLIGVLVFFSITEYLLQKRSHPETTKFNSFLITGDYLIAFSCGILEYSIEQYFFAFKSNPYSIFIYIGFIMEGIGLFIRFKAICHAGKSFNHLIQDEKAPEHVLVTDGIYRYIRHPSYLGFFIFAVGTQVMLQNLITTIGFIYVLWRFFDRRIRYEETTLIRFFGNDYDQYRRHTPTWIPFIK